jgi:hypothetical protein
MGVIKVADRLGATCEACGVVEAATRGPKTHEKRCGFGGPLGGERRERRFSF